MAGYQLPQFQYPTNATLDFSPITQGLNVLGQTWTHNRKTDQFKNALAQAQGVVDPRLMALAEAQGYEQGPNALMQAYAQEQQRKMQAASLSEQRRMHDQQLALQRLQEDRMRQMMGPEIELKRLQAEGARTDNELFRSLMTPHSTAAQTRPMPAMPAIPTPSMESPSPGAPGTAPPLPPARGPDGMPMTQRPAPMPRPEVGPMQADPQMPAAPAPSITPQAVETPFGMLPIEQARRLAGGLALRGKTELAKMIMDSVGGNTEMQKNYEAARRGGYPGSFVDYQKDVRAPTVSIDQKGETEEAKAIGKSAGERAGDTMKRANAAATTMQRMAMLEGLENRIQTGRLAGLKMDAAQWAKALGVSQQSLEAMGIGKDFIGDSQAFMAVSNRQLLDMIGSGGFPANNFSDADREFLLSTLPRLANDPRANMILREAAKLTGRQDVAKARAWSDWRRDPANKGRSYDDFELGWTEQVQRQDLTGGLQQQAAALYDKQPATVIDQKAVNMLRKDPSPLRRQQFDEIFGAGAAQRALGAR